MCEILTKFFPGTIIGPKTARADIAKTDTAGANTKKPNTTVGLAEATALTPLCGFEDFLLFRLHFAGALMMALWPKNNKDGS